MSDVHPRPWRVENHDFRIVVDAKGDYVATIAGYRPEIIDLVVAVVNGHSPWIKVGDRLPELRTWVLGRTHFGSFVVAACNSESGDFWSEQDESPVYLSHWMPIPAPPPAH